VPQQCHNGKKGHQPGTWKRQHSNWPLMWQVQFSYSS
jgi:hypothetical protein